MEKDLHYLVTRVINPRLNYIIAALADAKVKKFREDYVDVKMYSKAGLAAKWLEDWRSELFHRYSSDDINRDPDRFLRDYMSVIDYVYGKFGDERVDVLHELWILGVEVEKYLKDSVETFNVGKLLVRYYSTKSELDDLRKRLDELDSRLSSESSEKLSLKERLDKLLQEHEELKAKTRIYLIGGFIGGFVLALALLFLL